jgi:hypothetical protein
MRKMRRILEAEDTRAGIEKTTGRSVDDGKTEWLRALANRGSVDSRPRHLHERLPAG